MTERFLKAKHWQLFVIPMIFQISMMGEMFLNITNNSNPDPVFMLNYMKFFPAIVILYMGVFFGWVWSVATGLQSKIPDEVTMKVKRFKILFTIPMIYILFLLIQISIGTESGSTPNLGLVGSMLDIIMPLHLFSMFCIFYSLYFVAKTFKTVELQRKVSFSDFAGAFFMICLFYPIGIWIIQPKINKMIEE